MNAGSFLSADGKSCTLNSAPVVQALEWMVKVYDLIGGAPAVYAFQSTTQTGQLDPFTIGRVAMKIDGYWNFPENLAQFGQNLNYGLAVPPLPAAEVAKGRTGFSWVSGWCFAIPSTARKKQAGWELLRFLASQRAAEIIGESNRLTLESQGRIYVPTQSANRNINQWLYEKYVGGNPAIAYYDPAGSDLKYAYLSGPAWQLATVDWQGDVGHHPSLVFDKANRPLISYYTDHN